MDFILTYMNALLSDPFLFFVVSFIALLFFGEPVILSIALISATTELISPLTLIALAIATAVTAECFWFFVGRYAWAGPFVEKRFLHSGITELNTMRQKLHVTHPFALLFVTRPFTGLTIVAILLLGGEKLSVRRFIIYTTIVNLFWTPLVVGIGYATGMGYTWALTLFEDIHFGFGTILILLIIVFIAYRYSAQKIANIALNTPE